MRRGIALLLALYLMTGIRRTPPSGPWTVTLSLWVISSASI